MVASELTVAMPDAIRQAAPYRLEVHANRYLPIRSGSMIRLRNRVWPQSFSGLRSMCEVSLFYRGECPISVSVH